MLNHRIGLLLHYQKIVVLQLASVFLVRVFRNILIPSVRMSLTMRKMFARIIYKPLSERLIIALKKKVVLASVFCFLVRVSTKNPDCVCHSCSFCIHRYSPCLNPQDTTAYYGLTFCTFPWPYVVKWHNSGIINSRNAISKSNLVFLCRDSSILLKKMFNYPIKFHNTTITLR